MAWSNVASIDINREWTLTPSIDADLGYFRISFNVGDVRGTLLNQPIWIAQVDLDSVSDSIDIYDERRVIASSFNRVLEFETPGFISNRGLALRSAPDFFDFWNITIEVSSVPVTRNNVSSQNPTSATANTTSIPASVTVVELLEANPNRKTASFQCAVGSAVLYLKTADDASATDHTVFLFAGDFYELNIPYTGVISGIWSAAAGSVLVTEFV